MNRSKRLNTLRHLKVAFSEQVHLVQQTFLFFLLLDAVQRAASLTKQLLMFSSKHPVNMRPLDLIHT